MPSVAAISTVHQIFPTHCFLGTLAGSHFPTPFKVRGSSSFSQLHPRTDSELVLQIQKYVEVIFPKKESNISQAMNSQNKSKKLLAA